MSTSPPIAAILIATRNDGSWLTASVRSALAQRDVDHEVIVIDDASTDGSVDAMLETIDDARLRVLRSDGRGKSVALNRAIAITEARYIAIQDGDDLSHPDRLSRQVACMEADASIAACFTGHGLLLGDAAWEDLVAPLHRGRSSAAVAAEIEAMRMPAHDPTALYRASAIDAMEFAPELVVGQGFDFNLQLGERASMVVLPEVLYGYRVHRQSNTRRSSSRRQKYVECVLRRACRRRGLCQEAESRVIERSRRHARRSSRLNNLAAHFIESVRSLRAAGDGRAARATAFRALCLCPTDRRFWKPLLFAITPMWITEAYRGLRSRRALTEMSRSTGTSPSVRHAGMAGTLSGGFTHVDHDIR